MYIVYRGGLFENTISFYRAKSIIHTFSYSNEHLVTTCAIILCSFKIIKPTKIKFMIEWFVVYNNL